MTLKKNAHPLSKHFLGLFSKWICEIITAPYFILYEKHSMWRADRKKKVSSFISCLVATLLYNMHRHRPRNQRSGCGSTQQGWSSAEAVIATAGSGQKINLKLWPCRAHQRTQNAASHGWEAHSSSTLNACWWLKKWFWFWNNEWYRSSEVQCVFGHNANMATLSRCNGPKRLLTLPVATSTLAPKLDFANWI